MAKGLDKEYHVYRCRLGHRHHRAGPAEGALCYEKGRFPRQLRREEGERARKAVSQRLEGRHAAPLAPSHPTQRWFARPTNTRTHTNTRPKAVRRRPPSWLAGWRWQSRGLACWLVGCSLLGGGGIGAKETERSLSFTPRTTRSTWNFERQVAALWDKEMCSPPSVVRG